MPVDRPSEPVGEARAGAPSPARASSSSTAAIRLARVDPPTTTACGTHAGHPAVPGSHACASTNAGLDRRLATHLLLATCATGARRRRRDPPDGPAFPRRQGVRSCSLLCAHTREDADVIRRPKLPWFSPNRASVLARSLLAAGPMQECQPSPLQCRIHEAREVVPPQCAGDDAAALGAEQASSAGAERGPRGRSRDTGSYASPGSQMPRARTKAGVEPPLASVALVANLETLGVVGAPSRMPTSSELRFAMNSGATPGPTPRSRRVLADRLTCDAQQALRRCRSHSPSGHQPRPPIPSPMDDKHEQAVAPEARHLA